MPNVDLWYEARDAADPDPLVVCHFNIDELMSAPFRVSLVCVRRGNVDLATMVGKQAAFRLLPEVERGLRLRPRAWTGVCSYMEQTKAEPTGESTYFLQIVPDLMRLSYRRTCRVFQQKTIPAIVREVLEASRVDATWSIDEDAYRKLDYRVQYNETDLDFVQRMLEEAGISYFFAEQRGRSTLVMSDAPQSAAPQEELHFVDNPTAAPGPIVTHVQVSQAMATGIYRVRDYDFRNPGYRATGAAPQGRAPDFDLEQYSYAPGHSVVETPNRRSSAPLGDDRGVYRSDQGFSDARAQLLVDGARAGRRQIRYQTNVMDLSPGSVFTIADHPNPELGPGRSLLVVEASIDGEPTTSAWSFSGRAAFADAPYRPPPSRDKPRVLGPQTAIVVGPAHEEIHVDELGRVRVQFHWDCQGSYGVLDEHSTCWVRVSQGWAGAGYGMMMIPRVGQEVLVGFLDGDPDQPIVVGRLFNEVQRLPYPLPQHKTVSAWQSRSTPSSGGFNEIKFDDQEGHELVYVQAQRDMRALVKNNQSSTVQGSRSASIGSVDSIHAGAKHEVTIAQPREPPPTIPPTRFTMTDKKITLTTGDATIELDGADIKLMAKGNIFLVTGGGASVLATGSGALPGAPAPPSSGAVEITSTQTMDLTALGNTTLATTRELCIASAQKMQIGAAAALSIRAGGDVAISGGPMVKINAPGMPAGRLLDLAPAVIAQGSPTVLIGLAPPGFPLSPTLAPRPGEDPRVTAMRTLLQGSPTGIHALEVMDANGVGVRFATGTGSFYDSATNTMTIDASESVEEQALTFVHEMNHAEYHHTGRTADVSTSIRDDYVDGMIEEESRGTVASIEAQRELEASGHDVGSTSFPLQSEYGAAHQQAATDYRNAHPGASDAEVDAAARQAGYDAVVEGFNDGSVQTSNTGETYPDYYGSHWDAAHPGGP